MIVTASSRVRKTIGAVREKLARRGSGGLFDCPERSYVILIAAEDAARNDPCGGFRASGFGRMDVYFS